MQIGAMLVSAWLTLGVFPSGTLAMYEIPDVIELSGSFVSELGVEAEWHHVFAGGSVNVPMWRAPPGLRFWPNELVSTIDIGVQWPNIRMGWKHTCSHAVIPYTYVLDQVKPRWDSGYDLVYLTIRTAP